MAENQIGIKLSLQGAQEVNSGLDSVNRGFTSAARGVRSISEQLDTAKAALIGYLTVGKAIESGQWIVKQASDLRQLQDRIKAVSTSVGEAQSTMAALFAQSNRWGSDVAEAANAFARLNPALRSMGLGAQDTIHMLDGISASLRLSGATTAETSSVLMQFAQAMGSGRVSGDEFRSMMENAQPLMRAVADQLGVSTGGLRDMAEQGKLTASVFANAMIPAIDGLTRKAQDIAPTMGQAVQALKNNALKDFGREFESSATAAANAVQYMADHTVEAAAAAHALMNTLEKIATKAAVAFSVGGVVAFGAGIGAAAAAAGTLATGLAAVNTLTIALTAGAVLGKLEKLSTFGKAGLLGAVFFGTYEATAWAMEATGAVEHVSRALEPLFVMFDKLMGISHVVAAADGAAAAVAAGASGVAPQRRASSAGQYDTLTKDLKYSEKIRQDYYTKLLNLEQSYADKAAELAGKPDALVKFQAQHNKDLQALLLERKQALEGAPDVKAAQDNAKQQLDIQLAGYERASKAFDDYQKSQQKALDTAHAMGLSSDEEFIRSREKLSLGINQGQQQLVEQEMAAVRKSGLPLKERIGQEQKFTTELHKLKGEQVQIVQDAQAAMEIADQKAYRAALESNAKTVEEAQDRARQLQDQLKVQQQATAEIGLNAVEVANLRNETAILAAVEKERLATLMENASPELAQAYRDQAQAMRQIAQEAVKGANKSAAVEAAQKAAQEWQKTAEKINDSITDALLRGFESGKDFAANLRDTVVNMFKTLVLRPVVSAVVNPVAQGITGVLGMSGAANAAGTIGAGNTVGMLTLGGSTIAAIGSSVATGISAGLAGTSLAGATAAYSAAGMTGVAGGLSAGSAIGSGLAAIGPVGWAALAAIAVSQLIKGNGGTPTSGTGEASATFDSLGRRIDTTTIDAWGGLSKTADKAINEFQKSYAAAAKSLGAGLVNTTFSFGSNTGKDGQGNNFALGVRAGASSFSTGGEQVYSDAAFSLAASRAVFAALQGSDLPAYLAKVFNGLTAGELSQDQITNTLAYAQTLKQVRDGLLETREPLQILKDNVAEGIAALGTSSETFKTDFVAAIDGGITPEKLAQWQGLQSAMTELAAASGKAADAVKDVGRSIADIANERQRLQDQLDELTLSSTELLAKQRNAIDASNRALFDQVQVAQTLRDELNQRNDLELQLLQLQGNTTELRRRELQAIAPANQGLQESIYALQDAKAAQDAYNTALANAQSRMSAASSALESAQNAVDAIRSTGTDQYLSALDKVAQAQDAIAQAAQSAAQKMVQLGQSLRDFVTREVLSNAVGTPSIAAANASFARTLAQAKGGNADAIAELESKGRIAIDAARAGSTSSAQFQAIRNAVLQGVSGVAATLPNATQAQGADLQQRLIDAQTDLAEALRVANAIGAPLQRQQADLIAKFGTAQSALASAQAEYAAASAVLEAIKTNTAQTAANVLDLNGNLVVQLHASAQSEITKLIKVIGDDTGLAPDLKALALMGTESVSKTIDLIATADITPDLKALALASSSAVVKTIGVVVSSSLSGDDKALALMVSDSVAKNIALAATSNLAPDLKTLALLENGSIAKYISLVANSSLSPDDKNLALMASSSVVKTIGAALGSLDATALSIALAQSDTLTRTISAVGGTLTADQRTVLQALTGASSVSVNVSGTTTANVMFDPADPIRSVWTAIQNSSAANAAYAYGIHSAISWIGSMVSNMLNHVNTVQVVFNRGDGKVYAKGGVFTNRVVDQPTTFDQGLMGEAGPEAIMPLRRGPDGSLGVVAAIDYRQFGRGNDALVAEIRTLREENRAQASAIVNLNQRMTKIFERWDGNGLPTERVEA